MYYIKCGTDYICKGSYIVNGEKYKIVGTIEEARAFKTYLGAQIALDVLEDANTYVNIIDCEIVEVIQMNKLQKVWNDLDKAYEKMERAIETLSKMNAVTTELENAIEKFDMSEISYMKQLVEEMMENEE